MNRGARTRQAPCQCTSRRPKFAFQILVTDIDPRPSHPSHIMPLQAASSSSSSKKRKYPEQLEGVPESISKKLKKDEKDKSKKRDKKGKARQTASDTVEEGEFKVIGASVTLSIPPRFAMSPISGVNEMLDSLIMRYVH